MEIRQPMHNLVKCNQVGCLILDKLEKDDLYVPSLQELADVLT